MFAVSVYINQNLFKFHVIYIVWLKSYLKSIRIVQNIFKSGLVMCFKKKKNKKTGCNENSLFQISVGELVWLVETLICEIIKSSNMPEVKAVILLATIRKLQSFSNQPNHYWRSVQMHMSDFNQTYRMCQKTHVIAFLQNRMVENIISCRFENFIYS